MKIEDDFDPSEELENEFDGLRNAMKENLKENIPDEYWEGTLPEDTYNLCPGQFFFKYVLGEKKEIYYCGACWAFSSRDKCAVLDIDRMVNGQAYGGEPFNHGWKICSMVTKPGDDIFGSALFGGNDPGKAEFEEWAEKRAGRKKMYDGKTPFVEEFFEFVKEKHPDLLRKEPSRYKVIDPAWEKRARREPYGL